MSRLELLGDLPVYCTHEEWEYDHPADLAYARRLAAAAASHGLEQLRQFPCGGALRKLNPETRDRILMLACDGCLFETTVKRESACKADAFIESSAANEAPF